MFPESVAADSRGNIYVGSITGTIYRARAHATVALPWIVPNAANGLTSLYGVLADDAHGLLWVCNNPPFGRRAGPPAAPQVKAFRLRDGALAATLMFPGSQPAACNDIAISRDGTLFATDTSGGRLLRRAPGSDELEVFAASPDLVGVDGIAFAGDGKLYINNVRKNLVQRIKRANDGRYVGLASLSLSQPVSGPDGLRPVRGNRFLEAEGSGNRVTYLDIAGDRANVTPIRIGLDSSPGVTHVGRIGYATEGKIRFLVDPSLRTASPDPFFLRAFVLPG